MKTYEIGETYWFLNPYAGRGMCSCGTLEGWNENGEAVMYNKRYGYIYVTTENLDKHNAD